MKKGFTLIELLVGAAIIGLLSTLALANFGKAQIRARDNQRRSDLAQVRSALELARNDSATSSYPNSSSIPSVTNFLSLKTFLENKGYMKSVPNDPKAAWEYYYVPATSDYTLAACLENADDPKKDVPTYTSCVATTNASITFTAP